jgi:ribosome assembly protein 1
MCLVLNKIDRLILVRGMDGEEVYHALVQIVEQVNAIIAELIQADMMEGGKKYEVGEFDKIQTAKEEELMFAPEKGNVSFASAYDCWAFSLPSFCPSVAEKLGMNPRVLQKFMWGEYYYSPSSKSVSPVPPAKLSKVMFVQFIIEPLIAKYRRIFSEDVQ